MVVDLAMLVNLHGGRENSEKRLARSSTAVWIFQA
jgi:hypothetical protein